MKTISTASDLMQTDVVTVGPADHLRDAMALMVHHHVSGLPVLDNHDHCVGVLSVTDVLNLELEQAEMFTEDADEQMGSYYNPDTQHWESIRMTGSIDDVPDVTVREAMSSEVVSVSPGTPIHDVAKLMVDKGIHRVLVLDDKRFLHGIISALDFVQMVADDPTR